MKKAALIAALGLFAVPATARVESSIVVEAQRMSDDDIQSMVMQKLAATPNVTGLIGVESRDAVVTLTGWTNTTGQSWRAEHVVRGVTGVRAVKNEIRPRLAA